MDFLIVKVKYTTQVSFETMAKTRHIVHFYAGTISEWHHVDSYFVKNNIMLLHTSLRKGSWAEGEVASIWTTRLYGEGTEYKRGLYWGESSTLMNKQETYKAH